MSVTRWRGTHFLHSSRKRYSMRWPSHEAGSEDVGVRTSEEVERTRDHHSCARGRMRRGALARNDDGTESSATSPTAWMKSAKRSTRSARIVSSYVLLKDGDRKKDVHFTCMPDEIKKEITARDKIRRSAKTRPTSTGLHFV